MLPLDPSFSNKSFMLKVNLREVKITMLPYWIKLCIYGKAWKSYLTVLRLDRSGGMCHDAVLGFFSQRFYWMRWTDLFLSFPFWDLMLSTVPVLNLNLRQLFGLWTPSDNFLRERKVRFIFNMSEFQETPTLKVKKCHLEPESIPTETVLWKTRSNFMSR